MPTGTRNDGRYVSLHYLQHNETSDTCLVAESWFRNEAADWALQDHAALYMGVLSVAHGLAVLAAPVRAFAGPTMLTVVLLAFPVHATAHRAMTAAV